MTAGVALIALGLLSFNAFATFTAQVTPTHATDTGDMELACNPVGCGNAVNSRISVASTDIAPGDTMQRTLTLTVTNNGDVMSSLTFTGNGTGTDSFLTDDTNGLQIWIAKCSAPWTEAGVSPAYTYTCAGPAIQSDVLGTSVSPVNFDNQAAAALTNVTLTDGATNYLMAKLTFPSAAPDTMEGQASTLSLQFDGVQRAGTNK
ncbi:MAG: hypothetical protein ACT4OX_00745 [Actinomycetota bacterium]